MEQKKWSWASKLGLIECSAAQSVLQQQKKKSRETLVVFNVDHALWFNLKVMSRSADNSNVTTCVCRFGGVFGCEEASLPTETSRKRKTERANNFQTFRTDCYMQHLSKEHPVKWAAYQGLPLDSDKEAFFSQVLVPFISTTASHFDGSGYLQFDIGLLIVDVIIGELLFHPGDVEGMMHKRALGLFQAHGVGNGGQ